jgi:hypothetical protein
MRSWKIDAENGAEENQDHAKRHLPPPTGTHARPAYRMGPEEHHRSSNDVYERSKVENIRIALSQTDYPLALSTQWL